MILKGYIFAVVYCLLCLIISVLAYKLGMPKKYSRKITHILVGFEWVILSEYMGATYHFLIVCAVFTAGLAVAYFKKLMPMLSSDSDNAPGTVYYGVAMTVMSFICLFEPLMMLPFGIGVLCTSVGDGFAGIVGQLIKKGNPKIYGNKTLLGALTNFVCSFGVAIAFKYIYAEEFTLTVFQCICVGLFSVGLEMITNYGLDNITITLGTAFLTHAFIVENAMSNGLAGVSNILLPLLLTPVIIIVSKEKKVLTNTGLFFAIVLDIAVAMTLGNIGFLLLLAFLVFSVLIDKVKKKKKHIDDVSKRGDCRDQIQVLANGLVPMVMALLAATTGNGLFFAGYVAALAEAFADTAASGMGVFSKNTFDIFKMKKCKCGLSGGMSVVGTLASLFAGFLIAAIALLFNAISLKMFLVIGISAFIGTVFDSFLGSVFQIKFKCTVCGELTEKETHCDAPTRQVSGFAFFDNDVVNLFSGLFASVIAIVCCILFI